MDTLMVPAAELAELAVALLGACGLTPSAAASAAAAADYANRRDLVRYGICAVVEKYCPRLRAGRINPDAVIRTVRDRGAIAVLDGDGGLGPVIMTKATDLATTKARAHGIGAVAVRGSTHFGAAGYYPARLAEEGFVGLVATNCGATGMVPPLGGKVRLLGTNPLAAAVPGGTVPSFVLDMSTTTVSAGRVKDAANTPVPAGWLSEPDEREVTDPDLYRTGDADLTWLGGRRQTGANKGFGLGLLVELLCGPLAGAAFGPDRRVNEADDGTGHLVVAMDPAAFGDPQYFQEAVEELLGSVRACPPTSPGTEVRYPGVAAAYLARTVETAGVAVPGRVVAGVRNLAKDLGVALSPVWRESENC